MCKKYVVMLTVLFVMLLSACGKEESKGGTKRSDVTPTGITATDALTPSPVTTEIPTATPTEAPTAAPTLTPWPRTTGAPVPNGYSDEELKALAIAEANEVTFAYRAVNEVKGLELSVLGGFFFSANIAFTDQKYDKVVSYFDADGEERLTRFYLNGKEVGSRSTGHFGTLDTIDGQVTYFSTYLPYKKTDDQGRIIVELKEGSKLFYEYDTLGQLSCKREYSGDELSGETLYTYDGSGQKTSEESRSYYIGLDENRMHYAKKLIYSDGKLVREELFFEYGSTSYYQYNRLNEDGLICGDLTELYYGESYVTDYEYNKAGDLSSETVRNERNEEIIRKDYAYTQDEAGRITGVTVTYTLNGKTVDAKDIYEIKYYNNGPVMVVPKVEQGGKTVIDGGSYVFLPGEEITAMLKAGSGFSYDVFFNGVSQLLAWSRPIDSVIGNRFDQKLKDMYLFPKTEGQYLYRFYTYGNGLNCEELVTDLLGRTDFPLNETLISFGDDYIYFSGYIYRFDGDRLTESYICEGGGASHRVLRYDEKGQLTGFTDTGFDGEETYEFYYDNEGHLIKTVWSSDGGDYPGRSKDHGVITYSYDTAGKINGINGNFDYDGTDAVGNVQKYQQSYRYAAYSGNGND